MQVTGTLLYYDRAVDGTMLTVLSATDSEQSAPTMCKMNKFKQFLDYIETQPETILTY